jgi:glycine cleavage system transcriptional repressor
MSEARQFKALVAVGEDRPGLVHGISSLIHGAGASIEDSRMAVLGGEFAIILLVSGTAEALARLEQKQAQSARELGLDISLRRTSEPARASARHTLRVRGFDRPGIALAVTRVLAGAGVNVESLESRIEHQPLTGTAMFVLEAELRLPAGLSSAELEAALQRVSGEEELELELGAAG